MSPKSTLPGLPSNTPAQSFSLFVFSVQTTTEPTKKLKGLRNRAEQAPPTTTKPAKKLKVSGTGWLSKRHQHDPPPKNKNEEKKKRKQTRENKREKQNEKQKNKNGRSVRLKDPISAWRGTTVSPWSLDARRRKSKAQARRIQRQSKTHIGVGGVGGGWWGEFPRSVAS